MLRLQQNISPRIWLLVVMRIKANRLKLLVFVGIVVAVIGLVLALRSRATHLQPENRVAELISQLGSNEARIHDAAIEKLVRQGKAALVGAANHENPTVRRNAIKGLLRLSDPTTAGILLTALDDSDPWARNWAARGLGNIKARSAICSLLKKRTAEMGFVLEGVEYALQQLGVPLDAAPEDFGCEPSDSTSRQNP